MARRPQYSKLRNSQGKLEATFSGEGPAGSGLKISKTGGSAARL
jgi:hypothetical protein